MLLRYHYNLPCVGISGFSCLFLVIDAVFQFPNILHSYFSKFYLFKTKSRLLMSWLRFHKLNAKIENPHDY